CIFATAVQTLPIQLAMHRDQGVLKRIMATPLPASTLVAGKVLSIACIIIVEVAIVTLIGIGVFGVAAPAHPLLLLMYLVAGTAAFVALGFAMTSFIPTSESAPAISTAV